jgi:hypothetical protein
MVPAAAQVIGTVPTYFVLRLHVGFELLKPD